MCKFSIIVPCYNIEKNIVALFEMLSIRNYSDYEVIFIDDCSKDQTFEILSKTQALKKEYKNFRCFQTTRNGGPGIARNLGLKNAMGEYILFCDSDDLFDITILPKLNDFLLEHQDAEMVVFPHQVLKKNKTTQVDKYSSYNNGENVKSKDVVLGNLAPWAKLYKAQTIQETQTEFPARVTGEDTCFVVNYIIHITKIYKMNTCYYSYVRNHTSITHKKGIDFYQKTTFEVLQPIYNKYFPEIEIQMFAKTHLLTRAKQMCAVSLPLNEIRKWFDKENKRYPNWINQMNLKEQSLYGKIIYKAMYYNHALIIKLIMKLRELIY